MSTLQDLVEQGLGFSSEKTAAAGEGQDVVTDEMAKIAQSIGLFGDAPAAATEQPEEGSEKVASEGTEAPAAVEGSEKVASMANLFGDIFGGEEAPAQGEEKTAEALQQEKIGSAAFETFDSLFDKTIEKMAAEAMTGSATISSPTASISDDKPSNDARPPQTSPDNKPADAASGIDTTPQVDNKLPAQSGAEVVGDEQQKSAAAAVRKHMLLANVED
jgi:hypothetical protein